MFCAFIVLTLLVWW